ncbi:hypothetical protein BDA96_02G334100 [Sorghum bicolor]|uniref:Uncharacterized protein n=2 Tax=Sorghum bicolor TaxID=4558 RepID=A0A921RS00_SORBI|nr:uncharacterized protein LOC8080118 [Sorghum bicolor]EER97293.1 hypothetical protein SORBI_3002G318200 [Sorghum bicolor]KAG0545117.1 hypothetical protein BDA96_02G334100 [Sorghum bicolor]|eukprot:XP_002460772.1 uncharacterized protein LOC8080118 [Sorghum bicolor]
MGNCCLERPRRGGGGRAGAVHYARKNPVWVENDDVGDRKEEARKGEGAGAAPAAATEVKIRITRKQLEELLRRVEDGKHGGGGGGGAPVQEVISELLCVASTSSNFRHREEEQWRPSLQTIPE